MPITIVGPSEPAAAAIAEQLARLVSQPRPADRPLAGARRDDIALSGTHPVYVATLEDAAAGAVVAHARRTGWRALIQQDGDVVASADATDDDTPVVTQLNEGPFGPSTVRAVAVAEQLPDIAQGRYELRTLQVPALKVVTIWLHGDDGDVFVPLAPAGGGLTAETAYDGPQLEQALQAAAQAHSQFPEGAVG